jgi:hypothetical protein
MSDEKMATFMKKKNAQVGNQTDKALNRLPEST